MLEVRIHGKREQGAQLAAQLLSAAACMEGKFGRTFSVEGHEETGTTVTAWAQIDEREIPPGPPTGRPLSLIFMDQMLLHRHNPPIDLHPSGIILVNTACSLRELEAEGALLHCSPRAIHLLPATDIAVRHLGRPFPASAMVDGTVAVMGSPSLGAVLGAIHDRFWGSISECNEAAAREAYLYVQAWMETAGRVMDLAHAR